jgi:hypothetical protein
MRLHGVCRARHTERHSKNGKAADNHFLHVCLSPNRTDDYEDALLKNFRYVVYHHWLMGQTVPCKT